jgi:integrase
LFALFTGGRLSEMVHAAPEDFRREGGIDFFDIHEGPGRPRLKSDAAARRVPIHPELKRLGFLGFVSDRREQGWERVFEEVEGRRNITTSSGWSQAWRTYQRGIGFVDRRKVFHSFRHTFKRACRSAGIQEEVHDAITGHKAFSAGRGYGGEVPLPVTAEAIARVGYDLDLSRLHVR